MFQNQHEIKIKLRSFKSSEHINEPEDGPYIKLVFIEIFEHQLSKLSKCIQLAFVKSVKKYRFDLRELPINFHQNVTLLKVFNGILCIN